MDKSLIQINVTSEELMKRIQNFIERKREQVNISNIHDFIPSKQVLDGNAEDDLDTCARVRTLFKKRSDSKGHLKVFRVNNAWGPQTRRQPPTPVKQEVKSNLPPGIEERVLNVEKYLSIQRVSSDIYQRLKDMEDRIMELQAMSPEYAQFWKYSTNRNTSSEEVMNIKSKCLYNADDIDKQIKLMESQTAMDH